MKTFTFNDPARLLFGDKWLNALTDEDVTGVFERSCR